MQRMHASLLRIPWPVISAIPSGERTGQRVRRGVFALRSLEGFVAGIFAEGASPATGPVEHMVQLGRFVGA
jgi:hypothetical protein